MFHNIWYYSLWATGLLAFVLLAKRRRKRSSRLPYPPGPKGLPLIGNIRDIPPSFECVAYAQWSRQYDSSVIHLNLIGTHLVVVNTVEAAFELFDKRSAIYSDRPRLPMLTELMGWDILIFYHYGNKWRSARRIFHQFFNLKATSGYQPQQTKATHELLYRLAHTPEDFRDHVRLMAGSLILNVTYGLDVQSFNDPYIMMAEESMEASSQAAKPGAFVVDTLPLLKYVPEWVPGAGFKRKAREWRKIIETAVEGPYRHVRDAMEKGIHQPSITSQAFERFKGDEHGEKSIRAVSAVAFVAGADTTVSALHTFFLAMVLYPDVVRKAQEELDIVVGQDRLPELSDKTSLPYVCAVVKEVLRWYPVTPLGFVHRLMEDDIYEGRLLPAGSLVLGNIWAILHDESVYKNPEKFNPDRFLKDGQLDPDIRSPEVVAFGFGRRICPGRHLALSSLFLNIACILATFDIGKAIDEDGKPITPREDFTPGAFCRPLPFKCSIKPRSKQASCLIADAYAVHHTHS